MHHLSPVSDIMKPFEQLSTLTATDSLLAAKQIFLQHRFHHIPIVADKLLLGIISESDLFRALLNRASQGESIEDEGLATVSVTEYMTQKLVKIAPTERVDVAALLFKENTFHCLPIVVGEGELVGLITPFDILTHSFRLTETY